MKLRRTFISGGEVLEIRDPIDPERFVYAAELEYILSQAAVVKVAIYFEDDRRSEFERSAEQ